MNIIDLFNNNKFFTIKSEDDHYIRKRELNEPLDDYNYSIGHSILKQNNNYSIEINNSEILIIFYYETKICITGYINTCKLNNDNIDINKVISIKYRDKLLINNKNNENGNISYINLQENIIINKFIIKNNDKIICSNKKNVLNCFLENKIYNYIPSKNNNIKFLIGPHDILYNKNILNIFNDNW